jgi:putative ABC transport system substrate-binding protein
MAVLVLDAPPATTAQPATKFARIGCLWSGSAAAFSSRLQAFREGLHELGYREGQTVAVECRFADGQFNRLPALALEVVRLRPDVIVTAGDAGIRAARDATRTIPIVVATSGDLIGPGHAASLARPGGNVTGLVDMSPEVSAKRLQLVKEALPKTTLVAILWNPTNPVKVTDTRLTQTAARALGIQVLSVEARNASDLEPGFAVMARERVDALLVSDDGLINNNRKLIVDLAARTRLPTIYFNNAWAHAGGLMAYGPSEPETYRRAAVFVDKILRGAKPGDLPIEQPIKFELVINLKTAKSLGLTIPQSLLLRADQLIE